MRFLTLLFFSLALTGIACTETRSKPASDPIPPMGVDTPEPALDGNCLEPMNRAANPLDQFAWELHQKLPKEGNLFYSPFSISTALAMTSTGAKGETLNEMLKTLHLGEGEQAHAELGSLLNHLAASTVEKQGFEISTANALWGQQGYPWLQPFLDHTKKHYGAGLNQVDYIKAAEDARNTINAWVEKQTREKIKNLIPPNLLNADTRLVLTNAIYFKGNWLAQFDPKKTRESDFTLQDGTKVKVPTMNQTTTVPYFESEEFRVIELPYSGKQLSMVIFLPKKKDGLPAFEKQLNAAKVAEAISKLHAGEEVPIALPKFKMESSFSVAEPLQQLGMKRAFSVGADFSGMSSERDGLYIGEVLHKAFVEVNEEGTEAAAATAVIMMRGGLISRPQFIADHPFLFAIRDLKSNSLLFIGRVANPKG
jgi:serpin B